MLFGSHPNTLDLYHLFTNAEFALEYAKNINNKKIVLIDGNQLSKLMIDFNVGVSLETVYEIKKIDSDYFIEE